ncbi:hypothetical protein EFM55_04775 [Lactiplantibacillus pentosus]|nr:hypothetical protein [Lactiplantibacillus pentosus]
MSNWVKKHRTTLFEIDALFWVILYIFFGTNLIHLNIKQYIFENFPIWLTSILLLIPIATSIYLWPRKSDS